MIMMEAASTCIPRSLLAGSQTRPRFPRKSSSPQCRPLSLQLSTPLRGAQQWYRVCLHKRGERGEEYTKVICSYQLNQILPHPCLVESGSSMAKLCAIISYLDPFSSALQDKRGSGEYSTTLSFGWLAIISPVLAPYCKSLRFTHHTLQTYLANQATSKA